LLTRKSYENTTTLKTKTRENIGVFSRVKISAGLFGDKLQLTEFLIKKSQQIYDK